MWCSHKHTKNETNIQFGESTSKIYFYLCSILWLFFDSCHVYYVPVVKGETESKNAFSFAPFLVLSLIQIFICIFVWAVFPISIYFLRKYLFGLLYFHFFFLYKLPADGYRVRGDQHTHLLHRFLYGNLFMCIYLYFSTWQRKWNGVWSAVCVSFYIWYFVDDKNRRNIIGSDKKWILRNHLVTLRSLSDFYIFCCGTYSVRLSLSHPPTITLILRFRFCLILWLCYTAPKDAVFIYTACVR